MDEYTVLSKETRFWALCIPLIPSMLCSLFVLYHYLSDRAQRSALNNHVFVIIIAIGLLNLTTNIPWTLYIYRTDDMWQLSPAICAIWYFIDLGLSTSQIMFFAWACIERHIIIFHDRLLRLKHWRILFHYLPMIAILSYCMVWYSITFFFPPCENVYFDLDSACMAPCLWDIQSFSLFEMFANWIVPLFLITSFSLLLLGRVIWMKSRMHQANQVRKNLKMAVQLFSIISVYLLFMAPLAIISIMYSVGGPWEMFDTLNIYFTFIACYPWFINPFICLFHSNELRARLTNILKGRLRRTTVVASFTMNRNL